MYKLQKFYQDLQQHNVCLYSIRIQFYEYKCQYIRNFKNILYKDNIPFQMKRKYHTLLCISAGVKHKKNHPFKGHMKRYPDHIELYTGMSSI